MDCGGGDADYQVAGRGGWFGDGGEGEGRWEGGVRASEDEGVHCCHLDYCVVEDVESKLFLLISSTSHAAPLCSALPLKNIGTRSCEVLSKNFVSSFRI